ncbi:MAG: alpha-amylase family protein, partial [Verrucomicrobia bacterium]|nr:alpha-amylase family protein [Cytophagales bacterium]
MKKHIFLAFFLLLFACQSSTNTSQSPPSPMQDHKIIIYQMMTRLFGNKNTTNQTWGTVEQNGVGKFDDISSIALQEIKKLGITHVWYTGVIEHALLTDYSAFGIKTDDADVVKGRAGSPYAIKDYYDVNPDLAANVKNRMQEFENLVARTHQNGLKVIIDFVPNHVARSYQSDAKPAGVKDLGENDENTRSFAPNNNFYYLPGKSFTPPANPILAALNLKNYDEKYTEFPAKATGNDQFTETPSLNEWYETIKLNYGVDIEQGRKTYFEPVPDTWHKMKDILVFWAGKNVDGFRCDMAEMVPVEFWAWAIPQVRQVNPGIVFIAEIYNPKEYHTYLEKGKFSYLYDKVGLYDTLKSVIQGRASANDISACWQQLEGINDKMLRFLENHDEQRIASSFFAGDARMGMPMMTITATMHSNPVMVYFGQEVGETGSGKEGFGGEDGRTTIFDYWGVTAHQQWMNEGKFDGGKLNPAQKNLRNFYQKLLNVCLRNEAIRQGHFFDLQYFNKKNYDTDKVFAFLRYTDKQKLLVIVNFDTKVKE